MLTMLLALCLGFMAGLASGIVAGLLLARWAQRVEPMALEDNSIL